MVNNNIKICLIGTSKSPFKILNIDLIPWSENTEIEEMKKFDIGVMPLLDSFWERGKCGFKLIQYMGCSLPVIGSPVGVNSQIIENGVNGYLASSHEEWYDYLEKLILSQKLRIEFGEKGRDKVIKYYSKQVVESSILFFYKKTI